MASERRYICLPHARVRSGGFALITIQDAHIEPIRLWRNAQIDILRQVAPISPEQQQHYFETRIWPTLAVAQPDNLLFSFLEEGRLVGYGGMVHVAWEPLRAEVSFLLDPALTRDANDYGRHFAAYLGLLKQLAFGDLGFHRLFAETYSFRTEHLRVLEANGFVCEGRMRDHVRIGGTFHDSFIHGCLNDEG